MNTLRNYGAAGLALIIALSMPGCATLRPSRIPEMIQSLEAHDFSESERQTIGELLNYINQLENEL